MAVVNHGYNGVQNLLQLLQQTYNQFQGNFLQKLDVGQ